MEQKLNNYLMKRFPQARDTVQILMTYFVRIGFDPSTIAIGEEQILQLFMLIVKDFLDYKLDTDQLAELCEKIYCLIEDSSLRNTHTASFLIEVADLEIHLRKNPDKASRLLKEILKRYSAMSSLDQ